MQKKQDTKTCSQKKKIIVPSEGHAADERQFIDASSEFDSKQQQQQVKQLQKPMSLLRISDSPTKTLTTELKHPTSTISTTASTGFVPMDLQEDVPRIDVSQLSALLGEKGQGHLTALKILPVIQRIETPIDRSHRSRPEILPKALLEPFVKLLKNTVDIFSRVFRGFDVRGMYIPYHVYDSIRSDYFDWIFPILFKGILEESHTSVSSDADFWRRSWTKLKEHDDSDQYPDDIVIRLELDFRQMDVLLRPFTDDVLANLTQPMSFAQYERLKNFIEAIRTLARLPETFSDKELRSDTLQIFITFMEQLSKATLFNASDVNAIDFKLRWKNTNPYYMNEYPQYTDLFNLIGNLSYQ